MATQFQHLLIPTYNSVQATCSIRILLRQMYVNFRYYFVEGVELAQANPQPQIVANFTKYRPLN
jgi:hypothetical protein